MPELNFVLPWLGAIFAGAVIGSFLNVVIHRLPLMILAEVAPEEEDAGRLSLSWPPSHCPQCGAPIRLRHNIPLVGYAVLGGRCADCRGAISIQYPLVEVAGVAAAVLGLWRFGITAEAGLTVALLWALICVTAIDIRHQLIPDSLSGAILWTGLAASALGLRPLSAPDAILGAVMGYTALRLLTEAASRLMGREAMGGGDPKLLAGVGAWVGWQAVPMVFFGACVGGVLVALPLMALGRIRRRDPFPFGPFLAAAGAASVFANGILLKLFVDPVGAWTLAHG
ncbi:MAG: prepilin peptidase [Alphaproteobacteria bacterium]|nr:prepilin peptidase [Alphaproteobacteria bacterium]